MKTKPNKAIIPFVELIDKAHEIALNNPQFFLIAKEDANGKVLLFFKDRYSFVEGYGRAEEFLLDKYGEFTIVDSPSEKEFDHRKDIVGIFTREEINRLVK